MKKIPTGVIEDPRTKKQKEKNWQSSDLFGTPTVNWSEKKLWRKPYLIRNQDGSSQCMAYSGAKHLGINEYRENGEFVNLSPTFIYRKRANTGEGMWMQNLLEILVNCGSPKDEWFPCDGLSEAEVNNAPVPLQSILVEALKYRGSGYAFTPAFDIDGIARAIDISGSCVIIVRCNIKEWTEFPFIDPSVTQKDWNVNHGICATDYGLINGKKHILVEDSWGSSYGKNGQRWISEDFIKERMFGGGYVFDLKNSDLIKPKYTFTKDLKRSIYYNKEVEVLQKILVFEGCMAQSEIGLFSGYYGAKTEAAVKKLQEKYADQILKPIGLKKGTGYFGQSSRNWVNKKYG